MRLSISSVFITLIMVVIMEIFLYFLLKQKKRYLIFRADLIILLGIIMLFRLLFPLELPFTHSIYLGSIMNPIQSFFNFEFAPGVNMLELFCSIWVVGICFFGFVYFRKIHNSKKVISIISQTAQKNKVSSFIEIDAKYDYPVWITDLVSIPMVLGLNEIILIPRKNFSQSQIEVILRHEIQHVKNHDIYIKQFLNILMIIYWWFLPIYWLNNNLNLALEIRADAKATNGFSKKDILNYAYTLVDLEDRIDDITFIDKSLSTSANFLLQENSCTLSYRINYLTKSNFKKKSNAILLAFLVVLPFISNTIILEPWHDYPNQMDNTFSDNDLIENGYLVKNSDGTYTLFYNGNQSVIKDPSVYLDMGMEIK